MSKKNTVATPQEKETTQQVYKTPTGKVVTLEEKKKRREAREQEYQNFRINALRRRAKRKKMSEEDTNKAIEALKKQLDTPNNYNILLFFNPNNANLVKEALSKEGIIWKIMGYNPRKESDGYMYIVDADQEVLTTIREIVPPGTKVHPYVKKKPSILPITVSDKKKKPSNNNKNVAAKAKKLRKDIKSRKIKTVPNESLKGPMCFRKRVNEMRKSKAQRTREKEERKANGITYRTRKAYTGPFAGKTAIEKKKISANMKAHARSVKESRIALKKQTGTTVPLTSKKGSTGSEKASTTIKQAA